MAHGRVFGAWVDLRQGDGFGASVTLEVGSETAVFVPRGVANGYQALEPRTVYSYLVYEHWSPEARRSHTFLNLADPTAGIEWPIPLDEAELSLPDRTRPALGRSLRSRHGGPRWWGRGGCFKIRSMVVDAEARKPNLQAMNEGGASPAGHTGIAVHARQTQASRMTENRNLPSTK